MSRNTMDRLLFLDGEHNKMLRAIELAIAAFEEATGYSVVTSINLEPRVDPGRTARGKNKKPSPPRVTGSVNWFSPVEAEKSA